VSARGVRQRGEQAAQKAARGRVALSAPGETIRAWWDRDWLKVVVLVGAVLVAYQPVWQAGFIWDDDSHLTNNPCVVGPLGFKAIWTTSAARICPLTLSSFWVQHAIWGLRPLPYHLFTLLMHAGAAVVLWRVLMRLGLPGAWLGAALWALHPVQVESAAWITELKNTQSGLFYMLTGLFFVKARQAEQAQDVRRVRGNDCAALAFAVLAMASKSSTVILPLVLGLCAWWVERGWRWRNALRLAPYFVLSALGSALSIWTQGLDCAVGMEWARSWPERFIAAGRVVWFYLGKLLWPHPLMFIYPKWEIDAMKLMAYLPLALVLAALVILWLGRKQWSRGIFMAFVYFLAALVPVLGLLNHYFLRYSFVGDHFQYLASIGPLALAGAGIWGALGWAGGRDGFARLAACGLVLGVLGISTWQHARIFRDAETLWQDTLAKNPGCWPAHCNFGVVLAEQGRLDEAIEQYERALQLQPDFVEAHHNLGNELAAQGKLMEAIPHFERALQLQPDYPEAHNNLGVQLAKQGNLNEAIPHWERALQLKPVYAEARYNLGLTLARQGKIAEAIHQFQQALELASAQAKPALMADIHTQLERYHSALPQMVPLEGTNVLK